MGFLLGLLSGIALTIVVIVVMCALIASEGGDK